MSEIKDLNAFFNTKIKENDNNIENGFKHLAQYLINETILEANNNIYQICEIEFYYYNESVEHKDVYTHQNDDFQTKSNRFYFHNSGVDIAFGSDNAYGGILIRSIKKLEDNKLISGPRLVVQELLNSSDNLCTQMELKEKPKEKTTDYELLRAFRVGLNITGEDGQEDYIFKRYRYILNDSSVLDNLLDGKWGGHALAFVLLVLKHPENPSKKYNEDKAKALIKYLEGTYLKQTTPYWKCFGDTFKNEVEELR